MLNPQEMLCSRNDHVRLRGVRDLAAGGAEAIPQLRAALGDANDFVRLDAARSLGRVGQAHPRPEAAAGLLSALGDGNAYVRMEALAGLKRLPRALVTAVYAPLPEISADGTFVDCLERVAVAPLDRPPRCERCIAAVVSPGFEGYLDDFLTTLSAYGDCGDAVRVVFAVGDDAACRRVIAKHGALAIPCRPLTHVNAASKAVMYSVARVVDADKYLCLDTDMLVTGSLRPLFEALDVCHPQSLLACRTAPWSEQEREFRSLARALESYYSQPGDVLFLTGTDAPDLQFFKANSGLYAGRRPALLALDAAIRRLQPFASAWIDGGPHGRDELVFSLAMGSLKAAVEISSAYNVQLYSQTVEHREVDGKPEFFWQGERARILHFATMHGRPHLPRFRALLGLAGGGQAGEHGQAGTSGRGGRHGV